MFQLLRLKKPKKRLKLKKQEKPKRLDRLKNKLPLLLNKVTPLPFTSQTLVVVTT